MSRISSVLEKYEPKPEDEKRFVDKHVVQKHDDVAKNSEDTFKGGKKSKTRKADYEEGEDEKVYENILYRLKGDLTEEQMIDLIERFLEPVNIDEGVYNSFITSIVEEIYEQASDEEKTVLDEMLASDEGYEEILEMIAEACDCDDDEDDDDDESGEEDDDDEDVKEEAQSRWQVTFKKVKTLQRPVTVTARNTSEAIKKAESLARKNHDIGSVALQHTDVKKLAAV